MISHTRFYYVFTILLINPTSNLPQGSEISKCSTESNVTKCIASVFYKTCQQQVGNYSKYVNLKKRMDGSDAVNAVENFIGFLARGHEDIRQVSVERPEFNYSTVLAVFSKDSQKTRNISLQVLSAHVKCKYCGNSPNCEDQGSLHLQMKNSDKQLLKNWLCWQNDVAQSISLSLYSDLVHLQNQSAIQNGGFGRAISLSAIYGSAGEPYQSALEHLRDQLGKMWDLLRPKYQILHAFVRWKLGRSNSHRVRKFGYIPAPLLRNTVGDDWLGLMAHTTPYNMHYQTEQRVGFGEYFADFLRNFTETMESPGIYYAQCFPPELRSFHRDDMLLEKYLDGGKILEQNSINPGFLEGLKGALGLILSSRKYGKICVGESRNNCSHDQVEMNTLYRDALNKLPRIPFLMASVEWRWGVLNGSLFPAQYNRKWWELRRDFEGIVPPTPRDNISGLDPAATTWAATGEEPLDQLIASVFQFCVFQSLCEAAGEYDAGNPDSKPLHRCHIQESNVEVKLLIKKFIQISSSHSWVDLLKDVQSNGSPELSTEPLLNYFRPLLQRLNLMLEFAKETIGFGLEFEEKTAREYLDGLYEERMSSYCKDLRMREFYAGEAWSVPESTADNQKWSDFEKVVWKNLSQWWDLSTFLDTNLTRRLQLILNKTEHLISDDPHEMSELLVKMTRLREQAHKNTGFKHSQDPSYATLAEEWKSLRDFDSNQPAGLEGLSMRELFSQYVSYTVTAAKLRKKAVEDIWLASYESENFRENLTTVWDVVKEKLYKPLFDFVRYKLNLKFPNWVKKRTSVLPAHLFCSDIGSFELVPDYILPKNSPPIFSHVDQHITAKVTRLERIFELANDLFRDLGLAQVPLNFGQNILLDSTLCLPTAWDLCDRENFWMKMCDEPPTYSYFVLVHHELGHIQTFMQYKNEPYDFRMGMNPGLHETLGDVVALVAASPHHLQRLGLLTSEIMMDPSFTLNYLMQIAMEKIPMAMMTYMTDVYRWDDVFRPSGDSSSTEGHYNEKWHRRSAEFLGIVPPYRRNEKHFDPGALAHVASGTPYTRYFVSTILQFQLYRKMCAAAGEFDPASPGRNPLHVCNVGNRTEAGDVLRKIMSKGGSAPWYEVVKDAIGEEPLDPTAMIQFFQPLLNYFNEEQKSKQYAQGWEVSNMSLFLGDGDELVQLPELRSSDDVKSVGSAGDDLGVSSPLANVATESLTVTKTPTAMTEITAMVTSSAIQSTTTTTTTTPVIPRPILTATTVTRTTQNQYKIPQITEPANYIPALPSESDFTQFSAATDSLDPWTTTISVTQSSGIIPERKSSSNPSPNQSSPAESAPANGTSSAATDYVLIYGIVGGVLAVLLCTAGLLYYCKVVRRKAPIPNHTQIPLTESPATPSWVWKQ